MSFSSFVSHVLALIERAGGGISVKFSEEDNGKFIAYCSDGTQIIGNSTSLKLTARFGSDHQAQFVA